jgi:serine/threonine-protein kinase haspin
MVSFEPTAGTVKATIIDFGLSRVRENGQKAIWSAPPADVYEGVGAQWDVYRAMRHCVGDKWDTFHPSTNVLVSCGVVLILVS